MENITQNDIVSLVTHPVIYHSVYDTPLFRGDLIHPQR